MVMVSKYISLDTHTLTTLLARNLHMGILDIAMSSQFSAEPASQQSALTIIINIKVTLSQHYYISRVRSAEQQRLSLPLNRTQTERVIGEF